MNQVEIKNMRRILKETNACGENHLAMMTDFDVTTRFLHSYNIFRDDIISFAIEKVALTNPVNQKMLLSDEDNLQG